MANMTFKASLLPNTNLGYSLGSETQNWKIYGTLTGNASTATKLQTARTINGTAFDGTANITTANWGTTRTLTIGNTGKNVNGSANVSWSKNEILGSGTTAQFYRGDNTWSNTLTNYIFNTNDIAEDAANLSNQATSHSINFYCNGLTIPYQMDNVNDGGMLRVRGTSETTTIVELATWDDSGSGETIQFNYYPTASQITPTYSISVPKHSGILVTTDGNGASGTWGISITGNAATATKLGTSTVGGANQNMYLNAGAPTAGNSFIPYTIITSAADINQYQTTGIYSCRVSMTNAPITNHGILFVFADVGTKCQIFMGDNINYFYKRFWNNSTNVWNGWTIMNAAWA